MKRFFKRDKRTNWRYSGWSIVGLALILLLTNTVSASAESGLEEILSQAGDDRQLFCDYRIERVFPHNPKAFTQGLFYDGGYLFESTGLHERSWLRRLILGTGEMLQQKKLEKKYFGEGITLHGDSIIQLTWKSQIGFIYDKDTFHIKGQFYCKTEGWGLTSDGAQLIMSDGSATLAFLDPNSYQPVRKIIVKDGKKPVQRLNELEYIKGVILANVWKDNRAAVIDPESGQVRAWIDLSGLLESQNESKGYRQDVNGIAYDHERDRLFVTGKHWPHLFQLRLSVTKTVHLKQTNL